MAWVNTSPLVKTYTLEEFWALPDPPDHSKLELIAGVLYMSPPPEYTHDNIVSRLNRMIILELARLQTKAASMHRAQRFGPASERISSRICFMFPRRPKLDLILNIVRPLIS